MGLSRKKNGNPRENEVPNQRMEWGIQVSLFSKYPKNVCPKKKISPWGGESPPISTIKKPMFPDPKEKSML